MVDVGYAVGYARVSTSDQDAALQHDALTEAGCARIYTDAASGRSLSALSSPRLWTTSTRGTRSSSGAWTA